MMSPRVDVIIPTRDRSALVVRAVRSVLEQDYENFHIWVVDDASADDTQQAIERLFNPRITYLRHDTPQGGSAARNTAIKASDGPLVAFLDSDDEWLPGKLRQQIQLLEDSGADVAYCGAEVVDDEHDVSSFSNAPTSSRSTYARLMGGWCPITTSLFVIRRECLTRYGTFDTALSGFQDYDFLIRLAKGCEFVSVPDTLVRMHIHSGSRMTTDVPTRTRALQLFMQKWADEFNASGGAGSSSRMNRRLSAQIEASAAWAAARNGDGTLARSHFRRYAGHVGIRTASRSTGLLVASTLGISTYAALHRFKAVLLPRSNC